MNESEPVDHRVYLLSNVLSVGKEARLSESVTELTYVIANDTHRLIPYAQAVVAEKVKDLNSTILTVSSVKKHDVNAVYNQWLEQLLNYLFLNQKSNTSRVIDFSQLPENLLPSDNDRHAKYALWCPLYTRNATENGVLFLRDSPWQESEQVIIDTIVDIYRHAWKGLKPEKTNLFSYIRQSLQKNLVRSIIAISVIAALFIPVHLTTLAPAEVVAAQAEIVASPMQGVVNKVLVTPNQKVKQGDLLFNLENTQLQSEAEVAQKALEVARVDYLRASQQSFANINAQAELKYLKAKIDEQLAALNYAKTRLSRAEIHAHKNGIAVFNDPDFWRGRPVQVGERVMFLANPKEVVIQIWLPVADAVTLDLGADVRLFLNVDPNNPLKATLFRTAFEPEQRPDQTIAFRLRARLSNGQNIPRIGLRGTAKLYGKSVSLGYFLFRRPYAAVREFIGL